jgi:hypothetical protein
MKNDETGKQNCYETENGAKLNAAFWNLNHVPLPESLVSLDTRFYHLFFRMKKKNGKLSFEMLKIK